MPRSHKNTTLNNIDRFQHRPTIWFAALLLFVLVTMLWLPMTVLAQTSAPHTNPTDIGLTAEEQAWLKAHPRILLGATTGYPPMVIKRADGSHIGVLVEIFEQISRHLNTKIELHIEDSWSDIQEQARNREIDGLAIGGRDPSRDALYNATDIVMPTYFSAFGRSRIEYQIKSFSDLDGLRIGYKRAARPTRSLLEKLPSAILKPYDSHESMTQALLSKEIDVIVAWMSYDHWRKDSMQGTIDNILLIDEHPIEMVIFIRKDWPELVPILNKTISAIQQRELPRIVNKWFGQWPRLSPTSRVALTSKERVWLDQKHTVQVRIADWPPYQIVKDNELPQGIVIEYLRLIGERTGITFKNKMADQPFAEFLESMKQRQGPDMTPVIVPTPEREEYLSFSEPYIFSPYVIFMRKTDEPIVDIRGLTGKTLAVPRAFVVQEQLARDYPEIRLALLDSDEEALQAVATGQADAYIGNLAVSSHIIHKRGFSELRVTAASPFKEQALAMGNRKDWPELTSIIDKALASITEEEKTAIRNKYLAIKYEQGIDRAEALKWIMVAGGIASGFVFIFLFWNRRLSLEVRTRRQTEQELKRARDDAEAASRAKSTFLANMSHELRTPLHAILGFSQLLARDSGINKAQQEKLDIINHSGEHLLGMVDDILSLSRIEAGRIELKREAFDFIHVLQDVSQMMKSRCVDKGLRFILKQDPRLPPYVMGDAGKLRQVLINLLGNAIKFTKMGEVSLHVCSQPLTAPDMALFLFEVQDTGPGIPTNRLDDVFDSFIRIEHAQTIEKGTGLGLAISKSLVGMMNGNIAVESEPGKGSLFKVNIPLKIIEAGTTIPIATPEVEVVGLQADQPDWRILVVDDNFENRVLLKTLITDIGCSVKEADNGEQAIKIFQEWHPHFIWMDMRMPIMDGFEATRKLRALPGGETVRIVAVTANVLEEQRNGMLACGCDDVIRKPFKNNEIFESMARLLEIKYLFKDKCTEALPKPRISLTAEMLTELPRDLLQTLGEMALLLNHEAILEVIERTAEHNPDTAESLRMLAQNFQIERIRELLKEVAEKQAE